MLAAIGVLAAGVACAGPLSNPTQLSDGVSVSGSVAPGGEEWYQFKVTTDFAISSIETTPGTLSDTYMYLYKAYKDTSGNVTLTLIESDDDGGLGLASKIERPLAYMAYNYFYYVKVTAYSASQSGAFTIRMKNRFSECVTVEPDGRKYTGTIASGTGSCWYRINCMGAAPFVLETALGSCPDTYMYIYKPDNYYTVPLIASDDDSGEGYASRISANLEVYPSGSTRPYFVKVRAYSEYQTGTFQFWATPAVAPTLATFKLFVPYNGVANDPKITLYAEGSGAPTQYIVSESPTFSGASWQAFPNLSFYFLVSPFNGPKTVYLKLRNVRGESAVKSLSLTLNDLRPELTVGAAFRWDAIENYAIDSYRFYAAQAGTYRIETTRGTMSDDSLQLYGPNTSSTYIANDSSKPAAFIERYLSVGMYYVNVSGYGYTPNGTYAIRVYRK